MAESENNALQLAAILTQTYVDTISLLVGISDSAKVRNALLLAIRDADLAKVNAIERELGISPTTAQIRKWYKDEKRLNDGESWIRERSEK